MAPNPWRTRREKRALEQRELVAFRMVRQAAREELRALARHAGDALHSLDAARTALEAATTSEEVVAVEPYVRAARAALGVAEAQGRRSYREVVDAALVAASERPPQRRRITAQGAPEINQPPRFEVGG
jgi:hypothetical protein